MPSTFTWLDYSDQDRRRMLDVISQFGEKTTRDELGIGTVRDAFAELLFPGTSTIQTRARYFLFIPWMYRELERLQTTQQGRSRSSERIADQARKQENILTMALLRSEDTAGIFGAQAHQTLKRLPSSVYWQGLRRWGILLYPGTQSQYHAVLERLSRDSNRALVSLEEDSALPPTRHWDHHLQPPPPGFPQTASFRLLPEEATYLRERILHRAPGSLLAFLVDCSDGPSEEEFPWLHPQCDQLPLPLAEVLRHARHFSEVIHGASLLYNVLLAEKKGRDDWITRYRAMLDDWYARVEARREELLVWDRHVRFWELVQQANLRISPRTRDFVDQWLTLALTVGSAAALSGDATAREMIERRESVLKRKLARLRYRHALELWNGDAGAGIAQLAYRWPTVQLMVNDILDGLSSVESADIGGQHA